MTLEEALAALKAAQSKIDSLETELKKFAAEKNDAKVTELQKALDQAAASHDAAQADVKRLTDEAKTRGTEDARFAQRLAIVDGARILHGKADAVDTTKTEREIMVAALVSRDPTFKADGKSDDYVRARFDIAVEQQKKAVGSYRDALSPLVPDRANLSNVVGGNDEESRIIDAYNAGPDKLLKTGLWRSPEMQKALDGLTLAPKRPDIYRERFDGRDMKQRIDAWLANVIPDYARRRDADPSTMFFPRQLLYIMLTPYEFVYPEIKYSQIFPISYEVPTGARSYAWHMYDELGAGDIIDDYADEAPNAERKAIELIGKIWGVRSSYEFSIQDIRSGQFGNVPIEALKSVTARRIIERKCDLLGAVGDATRSMTGAANDANVPAYTLATKAAGGLKWGNLTGGTLTYNATPEEILRDVGGMATNIRINTAGAIEPDTLILGTQNTSVIETLRLDQFNMTTVRMYLQQALPWLKNILYWPRLDTAGAGSKERIILCKRDPGIFRFVIPQEFEQFPPEPKNLAFVIQCHKRWAEPQMIQPKGFMYADGSN